MLFAEYFWQFLMSELLTPGPGDQSGVVVAVLAVRERRGEESPSRCRTLAMLTSPITHS